MASKSTKKSSRLGKIAKFFNPRSFKGGLALFGLVFALAGGGILAYRSFAATVPYPPVELRQARNVSFFTTPDGVVLPLFCTSARGITTSMKRHLAICSQIREVDGVEPCGLGHKVRVGRYNVADKIFTPYSNDTWMDMSAQPCKGGYSETDGLPATLCKNIPNYFLGVANVESAYGGVSFGQIYRRYNGKWEMKKATYSRVNLTCSTASGDVWEYATTWKY